MNVRTAPRREKPLHVALSEEERDRLRERAMRERRSLSDVVRTAIEKYVEADTR